MENQNQNQQGRQGGQQQEQSKSGTGNQQGLGGQQLGRETQPGTQQPTKSGESEHGGFSTEREQQQVSKEQQELHSDGGTLDPNVDRQQVQSPNEGAGQQRGGETGKPGLGQQGQK